MSNVTLTEGNAGIKNFVFTVTLLPAAASTVTVNCVRANGTAVAPGDYTAGTTTLTFTPGQTIKTCTVPVVGDAVLEPNETFYVNLTNAVGASIYDVDFRGIGTILNDEGPLLSIHNVTLTEENAGTKNFNFTVSLSVAAAGNVTVNCVRANGTATAPSDYTAGTTPLTFLPGERSKTCAVPVVGDVAVEPNETFFVNLTSAVGATIVDADFRGIGTITNDD
jgi:Calx-beta domain